MKSPRDMRIIQIDITNACEHRCSNCTRFCGHYKKPFFMDFETFKRAVDSLDGFEGTVSMMGGEPTLHPEFEKFAKYIASKYPEYEHTDAQMLHPQPMFMKAIQELELSHTGPYNAGGGIRQNLKGPGLWSAMGNQYKKHYETIQDVFKYQALNDHTNAMYHQPILISRKELEIPDDKWERIRDACWVQNEWSAAITPKGAFFCEIAGALDMLFDGPGGWEIEPGWWKRSVSDFSDQLHWCELCGIACNTFSRDANEQIDDVSPRLYEMLKLKTDSPWMDHVRVVKIENGTIAEESKASDKVFQKEMPYAESYQLKFNSTRSVLYPSGFDDISVAGNDKIGDVLRRVIYSDKDKKTYSNYVILHSDNIRLAEKACEKLKQAIFNPGTLIYNNDLKEIQDLSEYFEVKVGIEDDISGFVALFSREASSIRAIGFDRITRALSIDEFVNQWDEHKVIPFDENMMYIAIETDFEPQTRYAIYGTGEHTEHIVNRLDKIQSEYVAFVDSNEDKQGTIYHGKKIKSPLWLIENRDEYDYVVIGSPRYYVEIYEKLINMGFERSEIVCNY